MQTETHGGLGSGAPPCSVICPDLSRVRIAEAKARTAHLPAKQASLEMQKVIGDEKRRYGQLVPDHWYGFELSAEWLWWHAQESANPADPLRYAENMRALSADMQARPEYYARRDAARFTHWQWFQRNSPNAAQARGTIRRCHVRRRLVSAPCSVPNRRHPKINEKSLI